MDRSEPADGNGCHKSASDGDGARDDPRHSSHWRAGASLFRGESYRWFGAVTCDTPNIQRTSPHPGALRAPTLPLQGRVTRGTAMPHKPCGYLRRTDDVGFATHRIAYPISHITTPAQIKAS